MQLNIHKKELTFNLLCRKCERNINSRIKPMPKIERCKTNIFGKEYLKPKQLKEVNYRTMMEIETATEFS